MNRLLIDTNIYTAFKTNYPPAVERLGEVEQIFICPAVHGELLAGFKCGSREKRNVAELIEFLDRPRVSYLTTDATTAEYYAEVYRALRVKGTPIPTNDMWIAASAMQHGLAVCTRDAHFANIGGLITIVL